MKDQRDLAIIKAAALAGYVLSAKDSTPANSFEWHKRSCEIADALLTEISRCYKPLFMADEAGKVTQVELPTTQQPRK